MPLSSEGLLADLLLEDRNSETLVDRGPGRRNGVGHGARVVEDEQFGRCIALDGTPGSYLELPAPVGELELLQGLTLLVWVKPEWRGEREMTFWQVSAALKDPSLPWFLSARLVSREDGRLALRVGGTVGWEWVTFDREEPGAPGGWVRLALVYVPGRPWRVRVRGARAVGDPLTLAMDAFPTEAGGSVVIESISHHLGGVEQPFGGNTPAFRGRLVRLSIYRRALLDAELDAELDSGDLGFLGAFEHRYPISFALERAAGEPARVLRLACPSGAVRFVGSPGLEASPGAWHLQLSFPPGSLGGPGGVSLADPAWRLATEPGRGGAPDRLYLLHVGAGQISAHEVALPLRGLDTLTSGSARWVRAELAWRRSGLDMERGASGYWEQCVDTANGGV
ncbi:LamG-like jellyroll fold domain-containing protein [Vitiosangium sp. GDMCC 1.1324]|uniref:LamG-like jellyroll fold domain-containing protein n=1 Tax=Vitiosangium sp. (strain GDMCC 1.1324) TaxID=2138576 RepID=UPI000D3AC842|nr:LamG-like jellyroll fold domain-containing protein [Vitiosangium sp. GDMCC 1.1324]PTL80853.1 hypothetical protein DAT35_26320 [Vitiosangium sp. GDMCC 1.1324]